MFVPALACDLLAGATTEMLKVGFFLRHSRYLDSSPVMRDMLRLLAAQKVFVETIAPDSQVVELHTFEPRCDLYLLKPGSDANLSLAGVLEARGARVLNDWRASSLVQDKIQTTARLLEAKLPVPESFVCGDARLVMDVAGLAEVYAKPHRGSYGEGVEKLVDCTGDGTCSSPVPRLIQQALPSSGLDIKVYVIGDKVFAIKRPFPAVTLEDKLGQPCEVTEGTRRLALAVGRLFDLKIYGVDMLETPSGLFIVDVNYFPSFIGIHDAAAHLADFIINYAHRTPRSVAGPSPLVTKMAPAFIRI